MKKLRWALLSALMICCFLIFGSCGPALSKPTNLKIDETNLTLSWDSVESATNYVLDINGKIDVSSSTSYSLADLKEGREYTIKIKARDAKKSFRDSKWSRAVKFEKENNFGVKYELINSNTEYKAVKSPNAKGDIKITDTYRGKPVTYIEESAFKGNRMLTSVVIGNNVKNIASHAFDGCSSVTSVIVGNSVKSLGAYTFANCSALSSIAFPDSLTEIGEGAFQSCRGLKTFDLPKNLTSISNYMFRYCRNLISVNFGEKLETIGESAFLGCDDLVSVALPDGVKTIGAFAFSECSLLSEVRLGAGLTEIGKAAFNKCKILESIEIPDGVTKIGESAFLECEKLKNVKIGSGVTKICAEAFSGTALWSDQKDGVVYADRWVVGCSKEITSVDFKDGTFGIADRAFEQCNAVNVLTIANSIKYIGDYAFYNCLKLTTLDIGSGVTEIGKYAFAYCLWLGRGYISLGTQLEQIGNYAFYGCSDLGNTSYASSGMKIPDTVNNVGTYAFNGTAFWKNTKSGIVYVDDWAVGFVDDGVTASFTVKSGTVGVSNYAFYKWATLGMITLPESLEMIGNGAFSECPNLSRVQINEFCKLTEIRDYTFYKCGKLNKVDLPGDVERIGRSAFYKSGVMVAEISQWITEIGPYAYYGCADLIDVRFEAGSRLKTIGDYAFGGCLSLETVALPDNLLEIGYRSFTKCGALKSITLGGNLTTLGEGAFNACGALEEIVLPESLTAIGDKAFYKCAGLKNITFGSRLEKIGNYSFYGCSSLTILVLPQSVTTVGDYAFRNCNGLTSFVIGENIQTLGSHVFNGCKFLTVYVEGTEAAEGWSLRWNSSYRPVIWGCTMSADGSYVVSVVKKTDFVSNPEAKNGISDPCREGYVFGGWAVKPEGATEEVVYPSAELVASESIPDGAVLTAVWKVAEAPVLPEEPPAETDQE